MSQNITVTCLRLPFDLVPLGEDLLGDARGEILLDLGELLVEGEFFAGGFGGKCEVVAAVAAEFIAWKVFRLDS